MKIFILNNIRSSSVRDTLNIPTPKAYALGSHIIIRIGNYDVQVGMGAYYIGGFA